MIAGNAAGDSEDHRSVAIHEGGERGFVAILGESTDQLRVRAGMRMRVDQPLAEVGDQGRGRRGLHVARLRADSFFFIEDASRRGTAR
jgi:hypothetical protein